MVTQTPTLSRKLGPSSWFERDIYKCDFTILFSSTMTNRQGQLFKGGKEKGDILMEDRASLGDITSSSKLHQDRSTRYHRFSSNANTNIRTNTTNNNNSRSIS